MVNIETYGLWTNKGGVGKTTLTFHTSTAYAHLHPEKVVIVCDMCPQANLSHTLLTFAGGNGACSPVLLAAQCLCMPNLRRAAANRRPMSASCMLVPAWIAAAARLRGQFT